jgi:dolichyl-phosphate-mannose-protein mannosyltransferase
MDVSFLLSKLLLLRALLTTKTGTRRRLYNSTGFFFLTWGAHYFPFFIMGRQLFLHHYLPAHLASALVLGALVEFIFNVEPLTAEEADPKKGANNPTSPHRPVRERIGTSNLLAAWAATGVIYAVLIWGFWFFAPLTYGKPGLSVDEVLRRKWLGYDLHFAK